MKVVFLPLVAAAISLSLLSCNTVTSVDYVNAYSQVKSQASSADVVGMWAVKSEVELLGVKSIVYKTFEFNADGTGRMYAQNKNARTGQNSQSGELKFTWSYHGNGTWGIVHENCRSLIRTTGTRLLIESWQILGYNYGKPMESFRLREVLDRANTSELERAMSTDRTMGVDWITKPDPLKQSTKRN